MTIKPGQSQKPFTWEDIVVSDDLGKVEGVVSDRQIKARAFAVDDYHDWYLTASPYGGRIAHPLLFVDDIVRLFLLGYDCTPPYLGGLHAKNVVRLRGPIRLDQPVVLRGSHVNKYERRGRKYRVLRGSATDTAGNVLLEVEATESVGFGRELVKRVDGKKEVETSPRIAGILPPHTRYEVAGNPYVKIGNALRPVEKLVSFEQSVLFSGFPFSWALNTEETGGVRVGIHTDQASAEAAGAARPIVQGLVTANHISEMLVAQFGTDWIDTGYLETTFLRPALVGDVLVSEAQVVGRHEENNRPVVSLEVWTKNGQSRLVTIGRARVTLSGPYKHRDEDSENEVGKNDVEKD